MATHFTFFASYYDCVSELDADIKAEFLDAICRYGLRDEAPKDMSAIVKALFLLAKPNLDKSKARRKAGQAGGKQKRGKAKQSIKETNCNQYRSDKETEREKDMEKEPPNTDEIERYVNFSVADTNPREPTTYAGKIKSRIIKQGGLSQADKEQLTRFDKIDALPDAIKQKLEDYKKILSSVPSESLDCAYSMTGESDRDFRERIKSESNALHYD